MKIQTKLNILLGAVCIFVAGVFLVPNIIYAYREIDQIRQITSADELIDVGITSTNTQRTDRGAIIIGDSIYLWKTYKPCAGNLSMGYTSLGEVDTPYRVRKEKGTSRFTVIKGGVTIDFCPEFGKKADEGPLN